LHYQLHRKQDFSPSRRNDNYHALWRKRWVSLRLAILHLACCLTDRVNQRYGKSDSRFSRGKGLIDRLQIQLRNPVRDHYIEAAKTKAKVKNNERI
jgi:hypothetical protein